MMDAQDVERMVDDKVGASLRSHKQMLEEIGNIFEKISGSSNVIQLNKLSSIVNSGEKFKRKSNKEQFKYNSSVSLKLEEAENCFDSDRQQEGQEKLAEGKNNYYYNEMLYWRFYSMKVDDRIY